MLYMASMTSYLLIRFLFLQKVKTPMMSSKFLHLKYLDIYLVNVVQHYLSDYSCLVSFLEASPALETFILDVSYALCTCCYLSETFKSIFGDLCHDRAVTHHQDEGTTSSLRFRKVRFRFK